MKLIKSILIVLFIVSVVNFVPYFTPIVSADNGKIWAEKTISAYIEARKLDIYPNTDKYNTFLKGVLLGDVPELTKAPSVYVKNDMEVQYIMEYAAQNYQSQQELLFSTIAEESSFEAIPSTQEKLSSNSLSQTGSSNAVTYAYSWATNGGYSRNPAYPDFGIDDCTNFISQAIHAGGLSQIGNGLTKRAPDVWDSAAFSSIFLASSFSCSQAESTPAHTQVTQTVGWLRAKLSYLFFC